MSALGGFYSRSGVGVDTRLLRRLGATMAQIGPDGEHYEVSTKVGMLTRPFITHDEARRALLPTVDSEGFMVTFDGWLDNRIEMVAALRSHLARLQPTTPEIVLATFKRWGFAGFAKLLGNFAFALWDPHQERLYLTADSLGLRPLYVHLGSERVVWASQARALVEACQLPLEIDLDYIAAFMTNTVVHKSPYRGVIAIPGGQTLIIEPGSERFATYWDFDPGAEVEYPKDEDYEERFRELFLEAVACRMRGRGQVFVEVSGGVDSSSIACVADHLLKRNSGNARRLETVSYVYDRAKSADERAYIRPVDRFVDARSNHHLLEEDYPIFSQRPPKNYGPDLPGNRVCFLARTDHLASLMNRSGSRVLLSGIGGDQAFLSESFDKALEVADRWSEGRWIDWYLAGYRWSRVLRRSLLRTLWDGTWAPLSRVHSKERNHRPWVGEWFTESFVAQCRCQESTEESEDKQAQGLPSHIRQRSLIRRTFRHYALQADSTRHHFEQRFPYLDRRILEFGLAIPFDQKLRPRESRSLVRRALRGWMPEVVLQRRTKAGVEEAMQRAVIREQGWLRELFASSRVEQLGMIDARKFLATLNRLCHGLVENPTQVYRTISLELWLRTFRQQQRVERGSPEPSAGEALHSENRELRLAASR